MEKTINYNIYSDALITPIMVCWITYAKIHNHMVVTKLVALIVFFVIPVFTFVVSYYLQKYVQKIKFGNYIAELKAHLADIEE